MLRTNRLATPAIFGTTKHAMLAVLSIFRLWPILLSVILLGIAFRLVS